MAKDKKDLKEQFLQAVDTGADRIEIYTFLRQMVARDVANSADDADRKDFYKIFLSLQKQIDGSVAIEEGDEEEDFLAEVSFEAQLWDYDEEEDENE